MTTGYIRTEAPPPDRLPANAATELVTEGFSRVAAFSEDIVFNANVHLNALTDVASAIADLPNIEAPTDPVIGEIISFLMPEAPTAPDLSSSFPQAPQDPTLTAVGTIQVDAVPSFDVVAPSIDLDITAPDEIALDMPTAPVVQAIAIPDAPSLPDLEPVSTLDIEDAPEFTTAEPVLNLDIAAPAPLDLNAPATPTINDVAIPDAPNIDLPAVPSMVDVVIPTIPQLSLPTFDAVLGTAPVSPIANFSFAEETYTSDLLDLLKGKLSEWVEGAATGIAPEVEAAIWNRTRDREQTAGAQLAQDAMRQFAARGFTRPMGALGIALQKATQSVADNSVTLSREIAIKQAEMEQSNRRFAIETAWNIESSLITYTGQIAARSLEVAKYAAQVGIEIFQAEVSRYQAEISAFSTRAEVFKSLLQAELSRLDIFRAEIEGQKLVGDVNQQQVQLYTARIGAAGQLVDLFRASVQASQAVAEVQKTRIQAFGAEVQAYGEQVRAKASEYDMYATQVKAEVSKAETFKVSADAYNSRINGFSALMKARTDQKSSEIDIKQRLPMEMFKARTEGFRTIVSGMSAAAEVDRTRVQLYSAETQALGQQLQANGQRIDIYKAKLDAERSKADTYRIQSDAYGARVTAYRAGIDALVAKLNSDIKVNQELPIELYKARTQSYDSLVRAEGERLKAITGTYEVQSKVFDSQVKGESARVGADTDVFKATTDANVKAAELELRAAEANVEMAKRKMEVLVQAMIAGAQVSAQVAAASLSQLNVSYGTSTSFGASVSDSYSATNSNNNSASNSSSDSFSVSHNYQHSED